MIRKAFVMSVFQGQEKAYKKRHDPIWPELQECLAQHGVLNYSIFFHSETNQLFAYVEFESEEQWLSIAETEVCKKWWSHMNDLMPTHSDNSPITEPLEEVFHFQK